MRARNIKPGFFTNDELLVMPALVRILFIGLWCLADRRGLVEDRPAKIKIDVLPMDTIDVDAALSRLQEGGLISRFTGSNGVKTIRIINFLKHQHPHPKEPVNRNLVEPCKVIVEPCKVHGEKCTIALNPESGILNPESLILNPESAPAGAARVRPVQSVKSEADNAARTLAEFRTDLDPAFQASDIVLDTWAIKLAEINTHGARPWDEITTVMRWTFDQPWWAGRILNAHDFRKHYDRLRGQWAADQRQKDAPSATRPEPGSEQNLRILFESLDFEITEGGIDGARAWIAAQREADKAALNKRLDTIRQKMEAVQ